MRTLGQRRLELYVLSPLDADGNFPAFPSSWVPRAQVGSKMSAYLDLLRAEALGSYVPNSFYIRATAVSDLDPEAGDAMSEAVAVHAHEYVHFLHNISTLAGLHL